MQAVYYLSISALSRLSPRLQVSGGVTANMEILTSETYGGSSSDSKSESERWNHTERPEAANLLGLCVRCAACVAPTVATQWRADVDFLVLSIRSAVDLCSAAL